jgi:hypothetical protein
LADEVQRRDGVTLQVAVGLNSGRVIAGEIGLGYAATGETVGFAQRWNRRRHLAEWCCRSRQRGWSSTAWSLAEPEWLRIKGSHEPVCTRRLLAISPRGGMVGRAEASMVGRRWEMAALDAMVDRAIGGRGGVVNVVGPPGIGKSRVAREVAAVADARGFEIVLGLLRIPRQRCSVRRRDAAAARRCGVDDLDGEAARARSAQLRRMPTRRICCCSMICSASPIPKCRCRNRPDARRRRLTA